ncbi:MAG: type II secretion system minor pseudopilin GspK [Deltaproteobacteria bacterium]|nr:type II secretion system minor pseudopilin GspK [Deltaproteobacteria bacterium]MBW2065381.1 type II secretion system minor pseudopilin GspK [Deltaproteobacteria bacterium]
MQAERFHKNRDGFALILTLLIISLIVVVSLELNSSMRSELQAAVNLKDGVSLRYLAMSGLHYAMAVLYDDGKRTGFDSLEEDWADPGLLEEWSEGMFTEGGFRLRIIDHSGRIQINQLVYAEGDKKGAYDPVQKAMLSRLLSSEEFALEPDEVENIIDAIKDWLDPDGEVTRFGAEDSYYKGLERPYACKNGPIDSLEELLLVRGITKELFYGTKDRPGIFDYLTAWGNGKININTAEPLVLMALSKDLDREMVEEMIAYRSNEDNDISQPGWYKKVPQMSSEVAIDDRITTSSLIFEIKVEAFKDRMQKQCVGFVARGKNAVEVLSWKAD